MKSLTKSFDFRKSLKGFRLISMTTIAVIALLAVGVAYAFTVGNIDGVWGTIDTNGADCDAWATGIGPTSLSTTNPNVQTGPTNDINQVRYGRPSGYSNCPRDNDKTGFNNQSGFGFDGNDGPVTPAANTPFYLGKFTHFNFPINASNSFEWVDLTVTVPVTCNDGTTTTNFTFKPRFELDETPNNPASNPGGVCPYPGQTDCSDKVTVTTPATQTFICPDGTFTVNILGFTTKGLGNDACDVSFNPAAISNEYITEEGQQNVACLWAEISAAKLEVIKHLTSTNNPDGKFNLQVNGVTQAANVGNNGTTGVLVQNITAPTPYTVSEAAGTGTDLGWYFKNVQCYNRNLDPYPPNSPTGDVASTHLLMNTSSVDFTLNPGEDVYCVITNADYPTAATIAKEPAAEVGQGVTIVTWSTASEVDIIGFNVYRKDGSGEVKLNADIIPAEGGPTDGADYQYFDNGMAGGNYTYIVKAVSSDGERELGSTAPRFLKDSPSSLSSTNSLCARKSRVKFPGFFAHPINLTSPRLCCTLLRERRCTMVEKTSSKAGENPSQPGGRAGLNCLLAYDGSEHAHAAISFVLDLPKEPGVALDHCSVTLISVMPTQAISGHEAIQAEQDAAERRFKEGGFAVQTILKAGNPADTINAYAAENPIDLIIIGAKGRRATLGILLGGVAQQVVEYSSVPVLVVRAPYKGLKQVLLVVDGSESSSKAVDYLAPPTPDGRRLRCAWLPDDARLTLMHVLPPPISDETLIRAWALGPEALYPTPMSPIDKSALEAAEQMAGEKLLQETARLLGAGGIMAKSLLVRGDAATEIMRTIQSAEIDLVVCGSRGLSAVSGWLLGSVSRKLVHYAGCSTLIVK